MTSGKDLRVDKKNLIRPNTLTMLTPKPAMRVVTTSLTILKAAGQE